MKDKDKTKKQLINELAELRKRITESEILGTGLEASEAERKQTEKALWKPKRFLSKIFDSIRDPFCVIDRNYRITQVNEAYAQMRNKPVKELIGEKCYETLYNRNSICEDCIVEKSFLSGDPCAKDKHLTFPDGTEEWVGIYTYPIIDEGSAVSHVIEYIRDITERKRSEKRQVRLLKELESANQELKDFAYIASHDLKAPLRAISSLANWIASDYSDKFDEDGRELMDLLIGRVKRMHLLIEGILQYSRLGHIKEEGVEINLNEIVREVIDTLAPPEHIEIRVENKLPTILCEETRIKQVFQNILSNAVKYIDKPKGEIKIGCVEDDSYWMFSITDNGHGIDEKYFKKIFHIFQALSPCDETESTGIGLALVKKIIEMYGGKIWVESKVGLGSTFFFTLPKHEDK